jgi:acetyl esterase/lipase
MITPSVVLAALLVLPGAQTVEKKPPTFEEFIRARVVLSVPGMDAVEVRKDLVYKTDDGEPLQMDVYAAPNSREPRPGVILVHGGPIPRMGARNIGHFTSLGELLAASGFVAVAFDHRFLALDRIPDAASDVDDLIAHVRADATELGIDRERIALWIVSGGGVFLNAHLQERPPWLRAVVAYYPILQPLSASSEPGRPLPPILIARAGLDEPELNAGIERFVHDALAQGAPLDLLNQPTGRHAFDMLDDEERSRQIIRHTLHFLTDHLAPE